MSKRRITRGKAIKDYCKESCCAMDTKSWKDCGVLNCPLWPFRLGKEQNPNNFILDKKTGSIVPKNEEIKQDTEGFND